MKGLSKLLKIEHEIEYRYTKPKIHDCGGDVSKGKRWYVYYSYLNPATNKIERQANVYLEANRKYKTAEGRLNYLKKVCSKLDDLLKKGWSPYKSADDPEESIEKAFDFVLQHKAKFVKETTLKDYKSRINRFKDYLDSKGYSHIKELNRKICTAYLNHVLESSSARNVNNTRIVLSSVFAFLEQNDIIERNYFHGVKNLKTTPTKHKIYTDEEVERIFKHLEGTELLLFIKFVSYVWLRPIEVCRIKKENIDTKEMTLTIQTKTGLKSKVIPSILKKTLRLEGLFSTRTETENLFKHTRDYYTKQFQKVRKDLKLDSEHTIYSFRHTYTTKVYKELRKKHSKAETIEKLMLLTGHTSIKGLSNYLRTIDAELPDDPSKMLI